MQTVEFQTWRVSFDPDATRYAYSVFASDPKDLCQCLYCVNFAKSSPSMYPPQFLALLDTLGIDARYPGEVFSYEQMSDGRIRYGGWFHFAGTVEPELPEYHVSTFEAEFKIGFSSRSLAPGHVDRYLFDRGFPVVQLDFEAMVPWVIEEPWPDP